MVRRTFFYKIQTHTQFYQFYSPENQQSLIRLFIQFLRTISLFKMLHSIPAVNGFNMISFQSVNNSYLTSVNVQLSHCEFEGHQWVGIRFGSMNEILKCMKSRDILSIQARDDSNITNFISQSCDNNRETNFKLKSNNIDTDQFGISATEYTITIPMSSPEFQRIAIAAIGYTVTSSATINTIVTMDQTEVYCNEINQNKFDDTIFIQQLTVFNIVTPVIVFVCI